MPDLATLNAAQAQVLSDAVTASAGDRTARSGTSLFGGLNIDPSKMPRLINALADADIGTSPAFPIFAFIGDSTGAGTRAAGDLRTNAYPYRMLAFLSQFMPIDENGWYGNQTTNNTIGDLTTYDTRLTAGAGIAIDTAFSIGGYAVALDNATGALTFTPTKNYDNLDLILSCGGTASTVGVQFGAGAVTNYNLNALNYTLITIPKALGMEAINITKISGAPRVQGMTLRNSTAPKVMLANMAKAGSASGDWAQSYTPGGNRAPLKTLQGIQPAAALINLGVNDYSLAVPVATFKANMQTILDGLAPTTDTILTIPFPSNITSYPTQGQYVQAIRDLAVANQRPLLDLSSVFTSWEVANANSRTVDNRHYAPRGYDIAARFHARKLRELTQF